MKRVAVFILCFVALFPLNAQNLLHTAFDTNGPVGDILFNQNEEGDIVYTGVVQSAFSADTLFGLAREFFYKIEKNSRTEISNRFEGTTMLACDVELPVGLAVIAVGSWFAGDIGVWLKATGSVNFNLIIDIRNGKYRYTLSNFITDRWRIPGEGKDKGQSNLIHWQRVNSLNKELAKTKDKNKKAEIEAMIEKEKVSYQMEYDAVMEFIEQIKGFATIEDF